MSSSTSKTVFTKLAPAPVGPYSQAVVAGEWLYCSGQIPLDPLSGLLVGNGNIEEETNQVIKNLVAVLTAAGAKTSQVIKTTIYGGQVGIIFDCRGRPLRMSKEPSERISELNNWSNALNEYPSLEV